MAEQEFERVKQAVLQLQSETKDLRTQLDQSRNGYEQLQGNLMTSRTELDDAKRELYNTQQQLLTAQQNLADQMVQSAGHVNQLQAKIIDLTSSDKKEGTVDIRQMAKPDAMKQSSDWTTFRYQAENWLLYSDPCYKDEMTKCLTLTEDKILEETDAGEDTKRRSERLYALLSSWLGSFAETQTISRSVHSRNGYIFWKRLIA